MRLSDLQSKYIVNINDGKNIGNIIDVKIDEETGEILSLIVETNKNFFTLFLFMITSFFLLFLDYLSLPSIIS